MWAPRGPSLRLSVLCRPLRDATPKYALSRQAPDIPHSIIELVQTVLFKRVARFPQPALRLQPGLKIGGAGVKPRMRLLFSLRRLECDLRLMRDCFNQLRTSGQGIFDLSQRGVEVLSEMDNGFCIFAFRYFDF